ncbi:MAG: alpha/beta hydrolase [Chloroflexota bacterium]
MQARARPVLGARPRVTLRLALAVAGSTLLAAIGLGAGLAAYVAWVLSHPRRKPIDAAPAGVDYRDAHFPSAEDELELAGWFLDARSARTVIMVHGYASNRLQPDVPGLAVATGLVRHGFNVLMFDLRNSGLSQGRETTIGVYEQRDVLGAISYVKSLGRPGEHIGLLGFSMGAAAGLLATVRAPDIRAIVADSSFADLYPYLQRHLPAWSHLPSIPFTRLILAIEPAMTKANPRRARPIKAVAETAAPILFIHGLADRSIPYQDSERLRKTSTHPDSELWLVPGAGHVKSFETDPQGYWDRVLPFLAKALR